MAIDWTGRRGSLGNHRHVASDIVSTPTAMASSTIQEIWDGGIGYYAMVRQTAAAASSTQVGVTQASALAAFVAANVYDLYVPRGGNQIPMVG